MSAGGGVMKITTTMSGQPVSWATPIRVESVTARPGRSVTDYEVQLLLKVN
jgi:hypothetical protein